MVLRVPFEQFPQAVNRISAEKIAYLGRENGDVLATAADPARGLIVTALAPLSFEEAKQALAKAGLEVHEGRWTPDGASGGLAGALHVAAVAFRSGGTQPGLWVDAFPESPHPHQVLRAMYQEMADGGEIGDIGFEEFLRVGDPNVVTLSVDKLAAFAEQKGPAEE